MKWGCAAIGRSIWAALFVFLSAIMPSQAANRLPIEVFAKLPNYQQAKLSPDIRHLAYLYVRDGRKHLVVQSAIGSATKPLILPPPKSGDFMWFRWANNERLLVAIEFTRFERGLALTFTRLVGVNADGSNQANAVKADKPYADYRQRGQIETEIVDMLYDDPDHILMALDPDRNGNYSVQKINVNTAGQSFVERAMDGVQDWLVDQEGVPRLGWGYRASKFVMYYKDPTTNSWEQATKTQWYKNGYRAVGFYPDPRYVYATGRVSGRRGLVKLDLITGSVASTLFTHPRVDLESILTDESGRKIIGVRYTDHYQETKYFGTSYQNTQSNIDRAAPGASNYITNARPNRGMYLVQSVGAQSRPGHYIFNARANQFYLLAPIRPDIPTTMVAKKQPVSYQTRDGTTIHGYLTTPIGKPKLNLPTVVLPHGGPRARDDQHYDFLSQFIANRGYAVFQPNFRGSSGYGYAFEKAGEKQWGGLMQDDVTDGTKWLISQGIADPSRTCIVGWSYGGYAALMGAVKTPELFKCAASINGVANMPSMVTHDEKFIGGRQWSRDMALEGEALRAVSPYHQRGKIRIPILLVADKKDTRVPAQQSKSLYRSLKSEGKTVTYIETDGGRHSLEHQDARLAMLKGLETFLDQHLGRH